MKMTTQTKMKTIDLLEISSQILKTGTKLHEKVKATGEPVTIPASSLVKKYPEMKTLQSSPVFKVRSGRIADTYACDTLCLFHDPSDNSVKLYDVELRHIELPYAIKSFTLGLGSFATVEIDKVTFTVSLITDSDFLETMIAKGKSKMDGEGTPDPTQVKSLPCPITPLHSLTQGDTYTITRDDGVTPDYETPMVSVTSDSGKTHSRVTCNTELARLFSKRGIGAKFQILSITERLDKDGDQYDSATGLKYHIWTNKRSKNELSGEFKAQMKVSILDLAGDDFSDFDI